MGYSERYHTVVSTWRIVGLLCFWYPSVMLRTSSATLELPEDILVTLSFHFLFTTKPTLACPLLASE